MTMIARVCAGWYGEVNYSSSSCHLDYLWQW